MKFSLINPSSIKDQSQRDETGYIASWPPLGLLYIGTVLKKDGTEISILDQRGARLSFEDTVDWVIKEDPNVLGFSTFSDTGQVAVSISKRIKEKNPDISIVFGNCFATFNAERILRKYPEVDIIVRGEGEHTIVDLKNTLARDGNLKDVAGITFRNGKEIISTCDRPLIRDLDSLPFPDRNMLDVEYHSTISGVNIAPKKFTNIVSSRGCVFRCKFCSAHKLARNIWRPRSVENILEELSLLERESYKQFIFTDDNFTLNPKRVIKLCKKMREKKIDLEWGCEGRVDQHSFEMFREMVKAGCRVILFGMESANQNVLDYYMKGITPQQSKKAAENARRAGIDIVVGSFIVGAPNETEKEILNTLDFIKRISIDFPQICILGIHPGMSLWDDLIIDGALDEEKYWETGVLAPEICTNGIHPERIREMIRKALINFVYRPEYILDQSARTLRSSYRIRLLINILSARKHIQNRFLGRI